MRQRTMFLFLRVVLADVYVTDYLNYVPFTIAGLSYRGLLSNHHLFIIVGPYYSGLPLSPLYMTSKGISPTDPQGSGHSRRPLPPPSPARPTPESPWEVRGQQRASRCLLHFVNF